MPRAVHRSSSTLDDIHATTPRTVQLLHFCARAIRDVPLLVIATFRDAEVRADADISELIGRIAHEGRTLSIRGLSLDEVSGVLHTNSGRRPMVWPPPFTV